MARQAKKENTENSGVMDQPDVESTVSENAAENLAPEHDAPESPATPENPQPTEDANNERGIETPAIRDEDKARENEPEAERPQAPVLESIAILSNRHRVPSWQGAAMLRMMGWDDGKMVTDDEYRAALDRLKSRRLGGGRLA